MLLFLIVVDHIGCDVPHCSCHTCNIIFLFKKNEELFKTSPNFVPFVGYFFLKKRFINLYHLFRQKFDIYALNKAFTNMIFLGFFFLILHLHLLKFSSLNSSRTDLKFQRRIPFTLKEFYHSFLLKLIEFQHISLSWNSTHDFLISY